MNNNPFEQTQETMVAKQKRRLLMLLVFITSVFSLSGCAEVGPDYVKVALDAPDTWHTELQGGLTSAQDNSEAPVSWWETLQDPQLTSLEKRAVSGNLDLQKAEFRIREARALRGVSRAEKFPVLNTSGAASRFQTSENVGPGQTSSFYQAGFDAGWEVDLFGGVRRSIEAAQANLEAQQEDLHDILVSLQAEVAINYLNVRTYQARLISAEGNLSVQEETYQLTLSLYQAGLIDELPVQQASYNMDRTRSVIPTLQIGLDGFKNRLAILLGEAPGAVHQELSDVKPIPTIPVSVAIGIPAEALRQRPDIRRAERELAKQTALIGVATADLYPKLRLNGTLGLEALSAGNFFESASRTWGIGPNVSWNIFNAGAIRQKIQIQTAQQEQALLSYQMTVLDAQEEVENALVAFAKEQLRLESLEKATTAAKRADLIARDKYQAGLVDFSDVLDAQRSLLALEDALAQSSGIVTANLVRLYKTLGGGWKVIANK